MTSETTDYQPKPRDKVLITVRAEADSDGDYQLPSGVIGDCSRRDHWVHKESVVRVEPAPIEAPTGWGARILATLNGVRNVRLCLADAGDGRPWRVHPDDCGRSYEAWVSWAALSDVVVLDPGEIQS